MAIRRRNTMHTVSTTETDLPLFLDFDLVTLPHFPSPPSVYALRDIPAWNEIVGQCTHPHEKLKAFQSEVSKIYDNVPRRQRSKISVRRKTKLTQVNDGSCLLGLRALQPNQSMSSLRALQPNESESSLRALQPNELESSLRALQPNESESSLRALQPNQSESNFGNLKDVKHMDEAKSPAQRKRKSKTCVDTTDFQPCTPRVRLRGQGRGSVGNYDALTQQGKLDSSTFEDNLKIIWCGLSEEKRNLFACLDSLWFGIYSQNSCKEKVLSWIKKENIFSKQYVLVPIVMWSHWNLLILCHLGEMPESNTKTPCMLLLDSMQTIGPKRIEPKIRKFVLDIHKLLDLPVSKKSIQKIPFKVPKVPQQKNGDDCGKYVLYFMKLFLENAPDNFNISEGYPYFMKEDWFTLEGLDNFWQTLVDDMKMKT